MSEIEIGELPARILIGKSADFYGALSPKFNGREILGPVWGFVHSKRAELGLPADSTMIGATSPASSPEAENGLMTQFVGIEVSAVPEDLMGLEVLNMEPGLFAWVEHIGSMDGLVQSVSQFYNELLPKAGLSLRSGLHLEIYDQRFDMHDPRSIMTIAAPIVRP